MLSDLDDLDQLRRIGIKIHHVSGFFGGLSSGVHRHANVSLGQSRRIVRTVTRHCYKLAARLFSFDERHLVFRSRLREKVVNAGFASNRRGGEWIVTRDHYCSDTHLPHLIEALDHSALDDVLQLNHTKRQTIFGNYQRRSSLARDSFDYRGQVIRKVIPEEPRYF